jgi:hypothetical protein
MRGKCSDRFESGRGRRPAWCPCGSERKKKVERGPCGSERRSRVGWAGQEVEAQWGGGERAGEEGRWPRLGRKLELGQSSRNKILSNFIWNLDF